MNADASRIIVIAHECDVCGTDNVLIYHEHFPELRLTGASSAEAAERLAASLGRSLDAVPDPLHADPVREAIADVEAFLNPEGAAHVARNL